MSMWINNPLSAAFCLFYSYLLLIRSIKEQLHFWAFLFKFFKTIWNGLDSIFNSWVVFTFFLDSQWVNVSRCCVQKCPKVFNFCPVFSFRVQLGKVWKLFGFPLKNFVLDTMVSQNMPLPQPMEQTQTHSAFITIPRSTSNSTATSTTSFLFHSCDKQFQSNNTVMSCYTATNDINCKASPTSKYCHSSCEYCEWEGTNYYR